MAKNKADLQGEYDSYSDFTTKSYEAHCDGRYAEAVELAVSSFEFVDGMMQFEKRFLKRTDRDSVESIEYVLEQAPLLLDFTSLNKVSELLKSQKRIDKSTDTHEATDLKESTALLSRAHRFWNLLEQHADVLQDKLRTALGGDQDEWRWLAEKWEHMGFIRRVPDRNSYRLSLATRLDDQVRGKCPSCGVTGKATKERMLEQFTCPKCRKQVWFVMLVT